MSDTLLTTQQTARLLGTGDATVINWAEKGIIKPAFACNGRLKFKESHIKKFIEEGGQLNNKNKK